MNKSIKAILWSIFILLLLSGISQAGEKSFNQPAPFKVKENPFWNAITKMALSRWERLHLEHCGTLSKLSTEDTYFR